MPSEKTIWEKYLPTELADSLLVPRLASTGAFLVLALIIASFLVWGWHAFAWEQPVRAIAKVGGIVGICLLSLNYVLSVRWGPLEKLFYGLDNMYKLHHILGKISIILLILHPLALIIMASGDWSRIVVLLVPGLDLPISLGIVSLIVMAILLYITLKGLWPYNRWYFTHRFMGLPLILGTFHALLAGSDMKAYPFLRYFVLIICCVGIISYIYMLLVYRPLHSGRSMRLVKKTQKQGITELTLKPPNAGFKSKPGQFVFIKLENQEHSHEYHPFTISNYPDGGMIRLSVKALGDFSSNDVRNARIGDSVEILGPYGMFGEHLLHSKRDLIFIAGGIGVTPFLSMLDYLVKFHTDHRILFIWSCKNKTDAVYIDEIKNATANIPGLEFILWISVCDGYLTADAIKGMVGGQEEMQKRMILMCAPLEMMSSIAHQLVKDGHSYSDIFFEDFSIYP